MVRIPDYLRRIRIAAGYGADYPIATIPYVVFLRAFDVLTLIYKAKTEFSIVCES